MAINTTQAIADILRPLVDGQVLTAGHPGYDEARTPYFANTTGRPAAVVQPRSTRDVATTVDVARNTGVPLHVRSGGHSWYGTGDGLLLDLGSLTGLDLDPDGGSVWTDAGLTAGELSRALEPHHLAVGLGDTATVGIGGLSLGGGIGFLARRHGLTIDSVTAAEIVTADGRARTIDAERDPDLFWAIRGGGGNVGVVTRFRFRTAKVPAAYGGVLVLPATPEALARLVAACSAADDRLTVIANVMSFLPFPGLPPEVAATPAIAARVCWAGEDGEDAVRPLREVAVPVADMLGPLAYADMIEETPSRGSSPAVRTMFLDSFDESVATTIVNALQDAGGAMRMVQVRVLGGAVSRVPAQATAYAHRSAAMLVNVVQTSPGTEAETARGWVRDLASRLRQDDRAYVNFLGPDQGHAVDAAYPEPTLKRLRSIKATYDPSNLFRHNVNIVPAHGR